MFPEAIEVRLPLKPNSEKENSNKDSPDNHNIDTLNQMVESNILPSTHLNGSIKLSVSEGVDQENKVEKVDGMTTSVDKKAPKHSVWRWPRGQGKFTQVCKF